jgi:hypothetical protein
MSGPQAVPVSEAEPAGNQISGLPPGPPTHIITQSIILVSGSRARIGIEKFKVGRIFASLKGSASWTR